MSFASKVLYTGDGVQKSFTITFPYMSQSHVRVFVNEIFMLTPMDYVFSGSSILFEEAPGDQSAIVIKRETSPTAILVDYVDGSTLSANDLDTGYLHNFYLGQEYSDSFNEVINEVLLLTATGQGITETDPDAVIVALVNEMLSQDAAANLQQRIDDIDANAEAIITLGESLQVQINTLAQGTAATVYVQADEPVPGVGGIPDPIPANARWYDSDDNNKPYLYDAVLLTWLSLEDPRIGNADAAIDILQVEVENNASAIVEENFVRATETESFAQQLGLIGSQSGDQSAFILDLDTTHVSPTESLAERFTSITASYEAYADAAVLVEQVARADADGVIAADLTLVETTVNGHTATIAEHTTSIDGVEAEYGVDLDVDGYITGFRILNGGTPGESAFVIRSDTFAIVDTTGDTLTEYVPFEISGGKINMRSDVKIDGDLLVSGSINGNSALSTDVGARIGTTHIGANSIYSSQIAAGEVKAINIEANSIDANKIVGDQLDVLAAKTGTLFVDESLTMSAAGHIKGGAESFADASNAGYWLGYSSGYKFSIGNFGTGNYMKWDGSTLTVKGNLFVATRTANTSTSWFEKKAFTIDRSGTVRLKFDVRFQSGVPVISSYPAWRVKVDGVVVAGSTNITDGTWNTMSNDIAVTADKVLSIELKDGLDDLGWMGAQIRNARVYGVVVIPADGGTVDVN
ncbi:MAG: phage tail fiber domain-containing protein [Planctomycetota bacterium]|jgi:hypothetical protein